MGDFSMLELFRTEVESQASVLNDGLLALEKKPDAVENIEPLMRAAHSIKGAARIVQLDTAVKLAHVMEDCFVAIQEGKLSLESDHIDILLRGVDIFSEMSQVSEAEIEEWLSGHGPEIEKAVSDISAVRSPGNRAAKKAKSEEGEPAAAVPATEGAVPDESHLPPKSATPAEETTAAKTPVEKAPAGSPKKGKPSKEKDSIVRVTAENLDSLMGLAGESLVDVRWFRPFSNSLLTLKNRYINFSDLLNKYFASLENIELDSHAESYQSDLRRRMEDCIRFFSDQINEFEVFARRSANLSNRLHREVLKSRMRPFADGVQGFSRMTRDLARSLGKKVRFEIIGENTLVDRDILERLEAPLNHLLRNSIDHGIAPPEERLAAGKPEEGYVRLEATHRAGMLSITVSDDGQGMDLGKIRTKIIDRKLSSREMAENLSENELMSFIFLPGFSTADKITEISGRGVGLDVVHSMAHDVGGTIHAKSEPGKSMSFHLQLPLTLSVIRTILVEISGEPYAFPFSRMDRCLSVPKDEVETIEDRQYFEFEGHNIGLVTAHQILEMEETGAFENEFPVIVIGDQVNSYGIVVDRFLGERSLVVQPIDNRLGKIKDISAAAIMADGSPILIIDVEDMVRSIENILSENRLMKAGRIEGGYSIKRRKSILVVDDSLTVRENERRLLENRGYAVDVAVNGMDGWNAVRSGSYDLVISDVDMPRMNGIELTGLIKNDPKYQSLPVIIVSYKDREKDKLKGLEAGADYYLTKSSFQDDSFIDAVIDMIGKA
ncbi:MAG: hybrid sensor histidine kinase/response regulator [Gemmatimonadota bacterium]|nr:hybrid sensor histidine kinase/response regulator [Gemmatimonadota bacterium]